jgi:hypothetical protein
MTTQTEAERLAEILENTDKVVSMSADISVLDLAAELRRLVSFNQQLMDEVARLQKREWVGLTDEEVENYYDWEDFQCGCGRGTLFEMVRDIESKLKEKNT